MSREAAEILALAERLRLPEPVLPPLAAAAESLPEALPLDDLADPEAAAGAWTEITDRIPAPAADDGMAQLAASLAAAGRTEALYRRGGVPEEIYRDTMDCFRRFLGETRRWSGRWAFDRGFWTWRQTAGILFRLGTLEFEYHRAGGLPLPAGLEREEWILSVHIPSDAALSREELDRSYAMARRFFSGGVFSRGGPPRAILCGSWLLAPALDGLLGEDSGIRRFAGDYRRYAAAEEDREFYQWLFDNKKPPEELPERTSLQRAAKRWLAGGGRIGMARGILKEK